MKPHRGTAILVLGILGIVVCQILGIVAWVMANNDLREMAAGTMDPAGLGNTQAGKICGIIAVVLLAIGLLASIAMLALGVGLAGLGVSVQ
jgi:hypothetical protein